MITAILLLALMQPQAPGLAAATDTSNVPDRTEKLTPAEAKSLADANQAVADAYGTTVADLIGKFAGRGRDPGRGSRGTAAAAGDAAGGAGAPAVPGPP